MKAVDNTIAGVVSGESALDDASPKGSLSQAKGQKSNELVCYSNVLEIGGATSLFFIF